MEASEPKWANPNDISNMGLTHLGLEAYKYVVSFHKKLQVNFSLKIGVSYGSYTYIIGMSLACLIT